MSEIPRIALDSEAKRKAFEFLERLEAAVTAARAAGRTGPITLSQIAADAADPGDHLSPME